MPAAPQRVRRRASACSAVYENRVGVGAWAQHTVWAATGNAAAHSVVAISVLWRWRANALALERRGPLSVSKYRVLTPVQARGKPRCAAWSRTAMHTQPSNAQHVHTQPSNAQPSNARACACATALHAPCTHLQGEAVGARTREHVARQVLGVVTRKHLQSEARLGAIELVVLS